MTKNILSLKVRLNVPKLAFSSRLKILTFEAGKTYLDHAGSQLPAKSLIDAFAADLNNSLYGNPHSASTPSHVAGERIDEIREQTLQFFNASPEDFDLVFVANTTAAVKLVAECVRDHVASLPTKFSLSKKPEFSFSYHRECHNSLVGMRELANTHQCVDDEDVEQWISPSACFKKRTVNNGVHLFAYPGQSNFNGRRLPLEWANKIRASGLQDTYILLDAAALATTTPLNINAIQPDFVALSFYKIFGFPDLGALIVRKASATRILESKRYFGGGTVDVVGAAHGTGTRPGQSRGWHVKRQALHAQLEEGTLPFHNIMALGHALRTHTALYGANPMAAISARTAALAATAYERMRTARHRNGAPVFAVYKDTRATYGDAATQGATFAFNVLRADGSAVGFRDVERAADARAIYVRSGAHCNYGSLSAHLGWTPRDLRELFLRQGNRCGEEVQLHMGRPTGVVRVSLGACSTAKDLDALFDFVREDYVDSAVPVAQPELSLRQIVVEMDSTGRAKVDSSKAASTPSGRSKRIFMTPKSRGRWRWRENSVDLANVKQVFNTVIAAGMELGR